MRVLKSKLRKVICILAHWCWGKSKYFELLLRHIGKTSCLGIKFEKGMLVLGIKVEKTISFGKFD